MRKLRQLARKIKSHANRCLDNWLPVLDPPKLPYQNACHNDRWIAEKVFPGLRAGYFVEAGACDGIVGSSCQVLETRLGWRGVCIEPHPQFAERLPANRPNSRCLQVCLSDRPETVEFVAGQIDTEMAFYSGVKANLERYRNDAQDHILRRGVTLTLNALPLAQVLDQVGAPAVIDYAAFDIEGSEWKVLELFPFERYRFRALTLECGQPSWQALTELLRSRGYREVKNPYNRSQPWERYWLSD